MRAGELNQLITIQNKTISYNSYNEPIEGWTDGATLWAAVVTTGGGEFYAAQKLNAETSCLFKIRFTSNITSRQRIKYGNRTFAILNINNVDGANKELQIAGKEVV